MEGGGGESNLGKKNFFGFMEAAGIFFSCKIKHRDFWGYCTFHELKINNNVSAIYL